MAPWTTLPRSQGACGMKKQKEAVQVGGFALNSQLLLVVGESSRSLLRFLWSIQRWLRAEQASNRDGPLENVLIPRLLRCCPGHHTATRRRAGAYRQTICSWAIQDYAETQGYNCRCSRRGAHLHTTGILQWGDPSSGACIGLSKASG